MKFSAISVLAAAAASLASAEDVTITSSFDAEAWSSASSEALASDCTFIFDVLLDINSRYTPYVEYMDDHGMTFPSDIANYFNRILTISEESDLMEAIKTKSFPFEDFQTMMTGFTWYSSLMSDAAVTTFYMPSDFLYNAAVETSSAQSTVESSAYSSSNTTTYASSSSDSISSIATSTSSSSSASSTSASSTSASSSASSDAAGSLYIPVLGLPLLLAGLFF